MKDNALEVLMYLFNHYPGSESEIYSDQEAIVFAFADEERDLDDIDAAIDLVEETDTQAAPISQHVTHSHRVYQQDEIAKLTLEARGFLTFLQASNMVDASLREWIITLAMQLDTPEVTLEQVKFITFMTLIKELGQEEVLTYLKDMPDPHHFLTTH